MHKCDDTIVFNFISLLLCTAHGAFYIFDNNDVIER